MADEREPIRGPATITCGDCDSTAIRVGAQDACDVYVCKNPECGKLTRIKVGSQRELDKPSS